MDFLPDLGESGPWDELLYFGPPGLLLVLFLVFLWFMGRWDPQASLVSRGIAALGLAMMSAFVLFTIVGVIIGALLAL